MSIILQPPEKIETPYDQIVRAPLWPYDGLTAGGIDAGEWRMSFCTDQECSALSGVPERSLLVLQTAEVIRATKAPVGHGTHRRVWSLPEAAVATAIECLKKAAKIDYKTAAAITFQAAIVVRMCFVEFVKMSNDDSGHLFGANLIVTQNQNLFAQFSVGLMTVSPTLSGFAVPNTGLFPVSSMIEDGKMKTIDPNNEKQREAFVKAFEQARFATIVNLRNVFTQFERDARKMRT